MKAEKTWKCLKIKGECGSLHSVLPWDDDEGAAAKAGFSLDRITKHLPF